MMKYINSLIRSRSRKQKPLKGKFEIVSENPHVTIKIDKGFFYLLVRCMIVGQAEIRKSNDTKSRISNRSKQWMWGLHQAAEQMKIKSTANEK